MNAEMLKRFSGDASRAFFNEFCLISHQINSFNQFITSGLKELFNSLGELVVEPGYEPSKGGGNWRHATITYGKVRLEKPSFWTEKDDQEEERRKLLPKHARLQNMTYSAKLKVEVRVQTFIAQEQQSLTRLWITDKPTWTASHNSELFNKRKRIYVKLVDASNGMKVISLYFLYATLPIWIMFFALDATSDKEVFQMIDLDGDSSMTNIILATIKDADDHCDDFRATGKSRDYVNNLIKSAKFPPTESFDEYISNYFFPNITGHREKALFLGYTVKSLLLSCFGKRKCDNKDDFRYKRLALVGELLAEELWSHIRHAEKQMVKSMQRDLYGDRDLQLIERYWDASIITNGLNRAFSTGHWCHPSKTMERCSGIVATLRRTNPLQMMSDLRKTRFQVSYLGKAGDARYP